MMQFLITVCCAKHLRLQSLHHPFVLQEIHVIALFYTVHLLYYAYSVFYKSILTAEKLGCF